MGSTSVFDRPKSQPLPDERPLFAWEDDAVSDVPDDPPADVNPLLVRISAASEVLRERRRQDAKWGCQAHLEDYIGGVNGPQGPAHAQARADWYGVPAEDVAKAHCREASQAKTVTWFDVLLEEVCEALGAETIDDLRGEVVQVAAVALAWLEALDLRIANGDQGQVAA